MCSDKSNRFTFSQTPGSLEMGRSLRTVTRSHIIKNKKKEKPHSYFIYKTVISPFFLYFISDIRPSYAATIIFEELPMEGRNNNNNNNNRLDP